MVAEATTPAVLLAFEVAFVLPLRGLPSFSVLAIMRPMGVPVVDYASPASLDLSGAVRPLRLIFWGGLLCVLDFSFTTTTNGQGFKFDILNDAVGAAMIAVGVFRLARFEVSGRYRKVMAFVKVVAVLGVVDAVRDHFVGPTPDVLSVIVALLGLATMAAIVLFCLAMRWLCESIGLDAPARSWRVTMLLFLIIYGLPLGFVHAASVIAILTGTSFDLRLGAAGLLLLPVFVVPIVHLFVSTSRMKRAAEGVAVVTTAT